jgi:hypothetical protein
MTNNEKQDAATDRIAGLVLTGAALLSVPVMAHHPTNFTDDSGLIQLVHGGLIFTSLILQAGFVRVSVRLGLNNFWTLLALIAFSVGIITVIFAGTMNGFIAPALAADGQFPEEIANLCWKFNQSLVYVSAYAVGLAFILWGTQLIRSNAQNAMALGCAALLAGGIPSILLATGVIDMHVTGALIVYTTQWLFSAYAGLWLIKPLTKLSGVAEI